MTGSPPVIVGLGEALYDLLPAGPALGGAPLNAAVQSHQLGNNAMVASRIGGDALGRVQCLWSLAGVTVHQTLVSQARNHIYTPQ